MSKIFNDLLSKLQYLEKLYEEVLYLSKGNEKNIQPSKLRVYNNILKKFATFSETMIIIGYFLREVSNENNNDLLYIEYMNISLIFQ